MARAPGAHHHAPDVARCTRLRHVTIADAWARWSEAHGIHGISPLAGPQFDQFQTIIRAVMAAWASHWCHAAWC
jgi:hypothetical protein